MELIIELSKQFEKFCLSLAKPIKESIEKTEQDIGHPMDKETKRLCVCFALIYLFEKLGK